MQQALTQDTDPPREEAVEAPDRVDPRFETSRRHAPPPPRMLAIVYLILALVKYVGGEAASQG
jgi:hypothetical protein